MSSSPRSALSIVFRILLVEDNPGDADLVRESLAGELAKVEIHHVVSLAQAEERLALGSIDVVLLDLSLPDATGLHGVERLLRLAPEVPIVVLTGTLDDRLGARAVQAGAQDYLVKGQTGEGLLIRAMRYAIERQQIHAERVRLLEREHAARVVAEAQRERASFLAEVSLRLAGSLVDAELDERLAEVASLAVPRFADCCVITRLGVSASKLVAVKHVAPDEEPILRGLYAEAGAVESSGPVATPADDTLRAGSAPDPRCAALLGHLVTSSVITARLYSHAGTEGAITLVHTVESGRRHAAEDATMMADLARTAGLAIENTRLYNEIRRAVSLREEFVAIASHELRTPLTTLMLQLGSLEGLVAEAHEPLRGRLVAKHARIHKQVERLDQLMNDLLDVARSSAAQMSIDPQRVDLGRLIRQVRERLAEAAAKAGCSIEIHDPEPVVGRWDLHRLEQLVTNLTSNALKYGQGRPVEIACSIRDGAAVLSVRDHGIGIAPDDARRIFERFERAVSARQFSGLGLGLHIARGIAAAHGGSIVVSSQLGLGATFVVRLPLEPPPTTDRSIPAA
jgi:signal transduction histidine kinase/CheY-like chemotaxis protein